MTREELRDYVDMQRSLNNIPYHVYSALIDGIDTLQQEPVLDKIRAEIEQTVSRYSISRERGGMGQVEWSDRLIKESEVLQILDKYKAEQEDT